MVTTLIIIILVKYIIVPKERINDKISINNLAGKME